MKIEGNKIVKIEDSDIINGTFELPSGVTVVGKSACVNNSKITKIPYGIVVIEEHAFEDCSSLVEIPDSVKIVKNKCFEQCIALERMPDSIEFAGPSAFWGCSSLKNVSRGLTEIEDGVFALCNSLVEIPDCVKTVGENSFNGCRALERMPDSIESIGPSAFATCTSLKNISKKIVNIPNYAFRNCFSLNEIPNSIKTVDMNGFGNCSALERMPDSIEYAGVNAFSDCASLKNVSKSLVKIGRSTFCNCTSLTEIPASIKSVAESGFSGCSALEKMPDSIESAGPYAFSDCISLKNISKLLVEIEEDTFYNCTSLKEMPDSIKVVRNSAFYGCSSLKNISKSLKEIDDYVFVNCTALETIPDGVVSVGDYAFLGCTSLKYIPSSVRSVGMAGFSSCSALEKMPDSIEFAGSGAFQSCFSLKNISKGLTEIQDYTFADCNQLESIHDGITMVGHSSFSNCSKLKEMPDSITSIGPCAFIDCTSLKKISNSLTDIPKRAFSGCISLEEMPNNIQTVENGAFFDCSSLETMSNQITVIGESAFAGCTKLKEISKIVKVIEDYAFTGCASLKTIILENIEHITKEAFSESFITKVITPYGDIRSSFLNSAIFIHDYLFLYANSLLKVPYKDPHEFLENMCIKSIVCDNEIPYQYDMIPKFQNLFHKMRKKWDITADFFCFMSLKTTQEFDLKIWNEINKLFNYRTSIDMSKAFAEMLEVFGLFVKDSNREKRGATFKQFFEEPFYLLTDEELSNLEIRREYVASRTFDFFQKQDISYYVLKDGVTIPKEFQIYLQEEILEEKLPIIKRLSGTYGKRINDFLKENYEKQMKQENVLTEQGRKDLPLRKILLKLDLNGHFQYASMHRMFDGCTKPFNPDFYEFFIDNLPFILNDSKLQSYVRTMQLNFSEIQKYYAYTSGTKNVNLKQVMDYLTSSDFRYHPGNKEAVEAVKRSGVVSQEAFDYYQDAFEKNQKRRKTSLVKRKNIYDIDGFKIKAELLRKDEIEAALVGEVNNTNCCQVYNGVGHNCMAHAVYSDDGGVFVTKLIEGDKEILLTQSWDWQNNNVYCHDNIESTPYLDKDKKLRAAVAKVFQLDGEYIIEKSKTEVESYITARRKTIERSLMSEIEKEKELSLLREMEERQVIRVVTSGEGNDDLGLSEYFTSSIEVNVPLLLNGQTFTLANFQPVAYNNQQVYFDEKHSAYTDSDERQYIIAGSLENLCLGKQEPLVPIYRDERRVVVEEKVRDYTFHKVQTIEKEAYPEDMMQHQDIGRNQFIADDQNVYLGEDWYMIYEKKNNQTIYISDLAKINPNIEDESGEQIREMSTAINNLLEQYEVIEADLKEDTSYLLYLMNKKRGYIEQIGFDERYSFGDDSNGNIVTEEEQQEILQNMKDIRASKNPDNIMHHVTFKKGSRWKTEHESKSL